VILRVNRESRSYLGFQLLCDFAGKQGISFQSGIPYCVVRRSLSMLLPHPNHTSSANVESGPSIHFYDYKYCCGRTLRTTRLCFARRPHRPRCHPPTHLAHVGVAPAPSRRVPLAPSSHSPTQHDAATAALPAPVLPGIAGPAHTRRLRASVSAQEESL
jgi:hypothetical protein